MEPTPSPDSTLAAEVFCIADYFCVAVQESMLQVILFDQINVFILANQVVPGDANVTDMKQPASTPTPPAKVP